MKIAFFTDTYYPDLNGVTVSVNNFAKELRKKGNLVYIFAPKITGKYKDKDKNLIRLPSFKILSKVEPQIYTPTIWPNKQFRGMFTEDFDIIHAHGNGPYSLLGYSIAKIKRIPFVMTFHTIHTQYTHYIFNGKIITPRMVSMGLKTFAHRCNLVITPSNKMKKELISYGVKKQIHVIPNFLEQDRFIDNKKGYLHKLLGLSESVPIILTVGRIGKEKNIDFILKVFKEVCKTDGKSHLVIVGKGPESDNLLTLAKKLGIEKRVHFTGAIDYEFMPLVYKDATVFVFASYTETQGICVLEASASGIPLVINNDEAFEGMAEDRKNGYILPLNISKFSKKIIYLLQNKDTRAKMGKKATIIAAKNFEAGKITKDLLEVYSKLLNRNSN
jgi:glycosyltransferase involved in cell wall biosynthesis